MNFNQETFFQTKNLPKIDYFNQIKTRGFNSPIEEYDAKKDFVSKYGCEIPNSFIISKLKYFIYNDIVLEIGAGLGLWAAYLKNEKIKVFPTDKYSQEGFCAVLQSSAKDSVNLIPANVLFLSHPEPNSSDILDAVKMFKGEKMIYIPNENPNHDKLLIEYIFRKFYVAQKYQINGFGQKKNNIICLKRK